MDVNKWFLSLPPERQAVLREDKWMLANAAAQAATEAERDACKQVIADSLHNKAAHIDDRKCYRRAIAAIDERSNAAVTGLAPAQEEK